MWDLFGDLETTWPKKIEILTMVFLGKSKTVGLLFRTQRGTFHGNLGKTSVLIPADQDLSSTIGLMWDLFGDLETTWPKKIEILTMVFLGKRKTDGGLFCSHQRGTFHGNLGKTSVLIPADQDRSSTIGLMWVLFGDLETT